MLQQNPRRQNLLTENYLPMSPCAVTRRLRNFLDGKLICNDSCSHVSKPCDEEQVKSVQWKLGKWPGKMISDTANRFYTYTINKVLPQMLETTFSRGNQWNLFRRSMSLANVKERLYQNCAESLCHENIQIRHTRQSSKNIRKLETCHFTGEKTVVTFEVVWKGMISLAHIDLNNKYALKPKTENYKIRQRNTQTSR